MGGGSYDQWMSEALPGPDPDLRDYRPIHPKSALRELAERLWAPIAVLVGLVVKFKAALLVVWKLKVFATATSMVVSIGAYAWLWGWKFGVGFVLLLLVHELGHVFELRRQGVPASAPMFIPFMGAFVGLKQMPENAWNEAKVALAGPLLGSIGAAGVWAAGVALDSQLLVALAFTGFFLNLFNLLPVSPLDGGRAVAAIHPALWAVGLVALLGLAIARPNPLLLIILVMGAFEVWNRWKHRGANAAYYQVSTVRRAWVGAVYLGLIVAIGLAMSATHVPRSF